MRAVTEKLQLPETREDDMVDVTGEVQSLLEKSGMNEGNVTVFVTGSTGAVTTIEFEPGLKKDFPAAMEKLFPKSASYGHEETWHDGNGHSHVRASMLKPGITVPFKGGELLLGTWQQIVFCEFDNKPRKRELVVQFIGE